MRDDVIDLIGEILCEVLDVSQKPGEEERLEWDSFDKMRFVLLIEERLKINLDDVLFDIVKAENTLELAEIVIRIQKNRE